MPKRWTDEELQILKEVYPTKSWKFILNSLPGRSRESVRYKAQDLRIKKLNNSRTPWYGTEIVILRRMYKDKTWKEIEEALPRHPKYSIGKKANELGLRRDSNPALKQSRYKIIRELREARRESGMKQRTLAKLVGTLPVQIAKWERGETVPRLASFFDWVEALGFKLELKRYD